MKRYATGTRKSDRNVLGESSVQFYWLCKHMERYAKGTRASARHFLGGLSVQVSLKNLIQIQSISKGNLLAAVEKIRKLPELSSNQIHIQI